MRKDWRRIYPKRRVGRPGSFLSNEKKLNKEIDFKRNLSFKNDHQDKRKKLLYIHIPFCRSICTFCSFRSVLESQVDVSAYIEALKSEMYLYADLEHISNSTFGCIYFGGGTPSLLGAEQLVDILSACRDKFDLSDDIQITIEGSPSSFDMDKLTAVYKAGVNRVSFGVQTFSDRLGKILNLPQNSLRSRDAIKEAHKAGFKKIDIDLLYPLPGQTMEEWEESLSCAIQLGIEHLSLYPLHMSPHIIMSKQIERDEIPPIPGLDEEIDMYLKALEMLEKAGYTRYSIDNFALGGEENFNGEIHLRHSEAGLMALGAAAFGRLNGIAYRNIRSPERYTETVKNGALPVGFWKGVSREETMSRFMAEKLRLLKVKGEDFYSSFGCWPEETFSSIITHLKKKELIELNGHDIKLTGLGALWGKNVCREFSG